MTDVTMNNVLLVVVGLLVSALQAFVLFVLNGIRRDVQAVKKDLWEEIQTVKRDHWAEIVRLRDKYHDLAHLDQTITNFQTWWQQTGQRP